VISRDQIGAMFADMDSNAPWDISEPLLWGYFFVDPDRARLDGVAPLLAEAGFTLVSLRQRAQAGQWWLHIEKVELHTVDSLHERNQQWYAFVAEHGIERYDGMDVGPASA
jgi:Regulator of ribonuclease activity B